MSKPKIPTNPDGETMKALCFSSFGKDASALSVQTIPKPFIESPDEILIKVHAASLNPIDKARLSGHLSMLLPEKYDTSVLSYDVSGTVEKLGEKASESFDIGDDVYVRLSGMKLGAAAEYVVCQIPEVAKKPSNISYSEAASIPLAGLTALQALRDYGGVTEGSKVFIPGGAGGVGSLAIQIAKKMLKASYVCTTASPGKGTEICQKAGADRIINYREDNFEEVLAGQDFDMAFDTMNEAYKMAPIMKKGAKIISVSGPPTIEAIQSSPLIDSNVVGLMIRFFMFLARNRKAERAAKKVGCRWNYMFMEPSAKDLNEITGFIESGELVPFIDTEAASLDDFEVAVMKLWSGRSKGKCVIKIQ